MGGKKRECPSEGSMCAVCGVREVVKGCRCCYHASCRRKSKSLRGIKAGVCKQEKAQFNGSVDNVVSDSLDTLLSGEGSGYDNSIDKLLSGFWGTGGFDADSQFCLVCEEGSDRIDWDSLSEHELDDGCYEESDGEYDEACDSYFSEEELDSEDFESGNIEAEYVSEQGLQGRQGPSNIVGGGSAGADQEASLVVVEVVEMFLIVVWRVEVVGVLLGQTVRAVVENNYLAVCARIARGVSCQGRLICFLTRD